MVRARTVDEAGNMQPDQVEWNRMGYGNNAIQEVPLRIAYSDSRESRSTSAATRNA